MSFSFSSLIRLLVLLAVGTTILAVGLSRLDPPGPGWRTQRPARFSNINEYFLDVADRTPHWLDSDTGQVAAYPLADGDVLEAASCTPWVDEKGRYQVVGRWSSRTKGGPLSMSKDFGIARYSFPSGEMLDQISTETVPLGPPCWFPGTRARVLFTAGDGMLYHYAFEPEPWRKGIDPEAKRDPKPKPLAWRCPKPGHGDVFIGDIAWPEDPRMGGCVVASLREQQLAPDGSRMFSRTKLFWLKLNIEGTEIVDIGRLLIADDVEKTEADSDHRSPTVGALADGSLAVAYLRQGVGEAGWQVRVAPIEFEADHQIPKALESRSLLLSSRCQPAHAIFSSDGRWLNAIAGPEIKNCRVVRLSLVGLFAASK